MEKSSGLTPLHLSAKLGVSELFDFIINTQNIYRFPNIKDQFINTGEGYAWIVEFGDVIIPMVLYTPNYLKIK